MAATAVSAVTAHETVGAGAAWTLLGAAVTFAANYTFQWFTHRDDQAERKLTREERLGQHTNDLAVQLLEAAKSSIDALRVDLGQARQENMALKALELRAAYCEEAIKHVKALLDPDEHGGTEAIRFGAVQFLARYHLMVSDKADEKNAEQRDRASSRVLGGQDKGILP